MLFVDMYLSMLNALTVFIRLILHVLQKRLAVQLSTLIISKSVIKTYRNTSIASIFKTIENLPRVHIMPEGFAFLFQNRIMFNCLTEFS